jgi:ankyrin repeat protein
MKNPLDKELWDLAGKGEKKDLVRIAELVRDPAVNPNTKTGSDLTSPFGQAVVHNRIDVVRLLLAEPRVDPNQPTKHRETPFYVACREGHVEIVQRLLSDPRIKINEVSTFGESPFLVACQKGKTEVVKLLLKDPRVDIARATEFGTSPFSKACGEKHTDIVKLLLEEDPERIGDINRPNKSEETPFWVACQQGNTEVVRILLKDRRIDVSKPNKDNVTPFSKACEKGHFEIVRLLLQNSNVDVNFPNKTQATPFFIACQTGNIEIAKMLLQSHRVRVNQPNEEGQTPLWIACDSSRSVQVVRWIFALASHVDTQARMVASNKKGSDKTAAEWAKENNLSQAAEFIEQYEKDPIGYPRHLRNTLGVFGDIAEIFALIVLFSDQYFKTKIDAPDLLESEQAKKFFLIAQKLPIELQMVLCNRAGGVARNLIPAVQTDKALKDVLKRLYQTPRN